MRTLQSLLTSKLSDREIAERMGVTVRTFYRYLQLRRARLPEQVARKQPVIFDKLISDSLKDYDELEEFIKSQEKSSLVVTDAYGKRRSIRGDLARLFGIESTIKVQNIQNNLQLNDNRRQVSMNGPVQIIVEGNGGQFDSEHGEGQIRMDAPSADEISSASG